MPLDGTPQRVTVPTGSKVRVELVRPGAGRKRATDGAGLAIPRDGRPMSAALEAAFYDLGTVYRLGDGNESSFRELDTEVMVPTWTDRDRAVTRELYLEARQRTVVGGSDRRIWSTVRLQSDSDETDGCITALTLTQGDVTTRHDLIADVPPWIGQPSQATRLASINSLPAGWSSQGVEAARAAVAAEALESWEPYSANRTLNDGTIVAHLLDGRYRVGVSSFRQFYSFDTSDEVTYKITEGPTFEWPDASVPAVEIGAEQASRVDVWLVPQIVHNLIQWYARYFFYTLFNYNWFVVPQTGVYLGRLPFYPQRYNLNLAGSATNAYAMSQRIRQTQTYARMIRQDLALQVFSRYFVLILVDRINGRWTIYQREIPAGQLVGTVEYHYQSGPSVLRYVWNRTRVDRDFVALDSGPLDVPGEVYGDYGYIEIIPF